MDILNFDPEVLEGTATIIEGYCVRQKNIMDDYLRQVAALSSEWTDDQTLGTLLEEIVRMKLKVTTLMDEIRTTYPQYFKGKATQIRNRPRF